MNETSKMTEVASRVLAEAATGSPFEHREGFRELLRAVVELAIAVSGGRASWDEARQWAHANAQLAIAAQQALAVESADGARPLYGGGEEGAERAMIHRSALTLFLELFQGTIAQECLDPILNENDEGVEADYRGQADTLHLAAPSWVPRSHSWWYWRDK